MQRERCEMKARQYFKIKWQHKMKVPKNLWEVRVAWFDLRSRYRFGLSSCRRMLRKEGLPALRNSVATEDGVPKDVASRVEL